MVLNERRKGLTSYWRLLYQTRKLFQMRRRVRDFVYQFVWMKFRTRNIFLDKMICGFFLLLCREYQQLEFDEFNWHGGRINHFWTFQFTNIFTDQFWTRNHFVSDYQMILRLKVCTWLGSSLETSFVSIHMEMINFVSSSRDNQFHRVEF